MPPHRTEEYIIDQLRHDFRWWTTDGQAVKNILGLPGSVMAGDGVRKTNFVDCPLAHVWSKRNPCKNSNAHLGSVHPFGDDSHVIRHMYHLQDNTQFDLDPFHLLNHLM
jgi:hypothetical protein